MLTGIVIFVLVCVSDTKDCNMRVINPVTTDQVSDQNVDKWCTNFMRKQHKVLADGPMAGKITFRSYECLPSTTAVMLPDSIIKKLQFFEKLQNKKE